MPENGQRRWREGTSIEAEKARKVDCPLEPLEEMQLCQHTNFTPSEVTSDLLHCRIINCVV